MCRCRRREDWGPSASLRSAEPQERMAVARSGPTTRRSAGAPLNKFGVAPKTVERWPADAELLPHARNRVDACRALKVDEDMIWPKAVQERVKAGHDRELAHAYPYRSACPSTVWGELIAGASTDIFFAGYTNYFVRLEQPAFIETLRRKIASGCRVRFLLGDPDGEVTRQREVIEDVALSVGTRIPDQPGAPGTPRPRGRPGDALQQPRGRREPRVPLRLQIRSGCARDSPPGAARRP